MFMKEVPQKSACGNGVGKGTLSNTHALPPAWLGGITKARLAS